jgi:cell volume regulation protein A
MQVSLIVLTSGIFIFLAHLFSGLFERTRIPDVLLLILLGIILGPVFGLARAADFGAVGPFLTTVTLVIMLFEGGLDLDIKILNQTMKQTLILTLASFFATAAAAGLACLLMTKLSPVLCFVLGAAVGSTSPAVIVPLVRRINMGEQSRYILFLESAISDVLSIVLALSLLESYHLGSFHLGETVGRMISSFILAMVIGGVGGLLWSVLLKKVRGIPNANFTTLAFVFVVFGLAETLGYSGFIAALAVGITLGNIRSIDRQKMKAYFDLDLLSFNEVEKGFFSEAVFLLKSFFFFYVGISVQFGNPWPIVIGLLVAILIFLIRIPVVRLALPRDVSRSDASLMSIMVPKGLAAVVLVSIALQQKIEGGGMLQNITYSVVFFSIVFTSVLVFVISKHPQWAGYDRWLRKFPAVPIEEPMPQAGKANNQP